MDGTKALFRKIRGRDRESFEALSESYGWKLYSHIRKNTEDRETADRIFSETFRKFYETIEHYDGEDPLEALLFSCADDVSAESCASLEKKEEMGQWAIGHEAGFTLPKVDLDFPKEKNREPLWLKIFYSLCILILILGILAAVWIMLYMLMSMNLIPSADLGYSWFNQNIANLF